MGEKGSVLAGTTADLKYRMAVANTRDNTDRIGALLFSQAWEKGKSAVIGATSTAWAGPRNPQLNAQPGGLSRVNTSSRAVDSLLL